MFDKRIFKKHLNEFFIDVMEICKNNSDELLTYDEHLPVFFLMENIKNLLHKNQLITNF